MICRVLPGADTARRIGDRDRLSSDGDRCPAAASVLRGIGHAGLGQMRFRDVAGGSIELVLADRIELERSEEHTSELQSLMRNSYAVFCLKNKKTKQQKQNKNTIQAKHTSCQCELY